MIIHIDICIYILYIYHLSRPTIVKNNTHELTTYWDAHFFHGDSMFQRGRSVHNNHFSYCCSSQSPHRYPLVNIQKTMENHIFLWIDQL